MGATGVRLPCRGLKGNKRKTHGESTGKQSGLAHRAQRTFSGIKLTLDYIQYRGGNDNEHWYNVNECLYSYTK